MNKTAGRSEGFTLLEILIVVALIGLLTYAFAPRGGVGALNFSLQTGSEKLEAELRYASERAVATGEIHRVLFDLDGQRLRLEHDVPVSEDEPEVPARSASALDLRPPLGEREFQPVQSMKGEWRRLEGNDVLIDRVIIGDDVYQTETVGIGFASDGSADAAAVELVDASGARRILRVAPFTSEIELVYGEDNG